MELVEKSLEVIPVVVEPEVIPKYQYVGGRKLKFCKPCKTWRDLEHDFHGKKVKKALCKPCTLEQMFDNKQSELAERFAFGDLLVSLCECKNYFVNTIPKKDNRTELREQCKACAVDKNKEKRHYRVSYQAQLLEKDKVIEELNQKITALTIKIKVLNKEKKSWQKN